jgi:hypothetical protein
MEPHIHFLVAFKLLHTKPGERIKGMEFSKICTLSFTLVYGFGKQKRSICSPKSFCKAGPVVVGISKCFLASYFGIFNYYNFTKFTNN